MRINYIYYKHHTINGILNKRKDTSASDITCSFRSRVSTTQSVVLTPYNLLPFYNDMQPFAGIVKIACRRDVLGRDDIMMGGSFACHPCECVRFSVTLV